MSIQVVQNVFDDIFGENSIPLKPETSARSVKGWDSFAHINLIVALEDAFEITFTSEDMAGIANVGDLIVILKKHGCDLSWDCE